ncbi:MAG: AbrB family transcriptional regulator [Caulobacter sp.]|nr:AbrB family transcriptional regulator [Caulobacter sp.]
MRVAKWGNSLAVRLPADVAKALDLKEGDDVTLEVSGDRLKVVRGPTRQELLEELRQYRGLMPADFKFNRDEANARD